jgi:hypothetical protein
VVLALSALLFKQIKKPKYYCFWFSITSAKFRRIYRSLKTQIKGVLVYFSGIKYGKIQAFMHLMDSTPVF